MPHGLLGGGTPREHFRQTLLDKILRGHTTASRSQLSGLGLIDQHFGGKAVQVSLVHRNGASLFICGDSIVGGRDVVGR